MAPRLLDRARMRIFGLLAALVLTASPALARKHQKHAAPQPRAVATEPAPAAEPPPRAEPERAPASQVSQADDDEVPGKKHKK